MALSEWLLRIPLREVVGAVVIGIVCGEVAGRLLTWACRQPFSETHSITTIGLALRGVPSAGAAWPSPCRSRPCAAMLDRHATCIRAQGEDMPEIRDRAWPGPR
ncbi:hypothetical protein [Oceaniglobus roseus]|uniref:hypothetical protein n=1 Tax=Oceaniglobus roseus TaxID=1737570 RepID=UPI000C7F2CDD|nr:hypothetical protein [Kandeliimicrobium roseum]